MPVMAYSPLGGSALVSDPTLARIAAERDCSATAIALAWVMRGGNIIAIPESGSKAHVKENAVSAVTDAYSAGASRHWMRRILLDRQMFCGRYWIAVSDGCEVSGTSYNS